ncbi:MAG: DedA family protein, partial [Wenzhouxiangellaceae bacterium]
MNLLQAWLDWIGQHPELLLLAGFALALIEALAVVGILVPGVLLLLMLGALVGWNPPLLIALCVAFALGAMAGDGISYGLGRWHRRKLARFGWLKRNPQWLRRGEKFFLRHGGRSVFIARFIGPLRPIVPLIAGSMGMPPRVFVPRMLLACALWAPAMVIPGALFGESLTLAAEFGGRLTVLLLVLAVGVWMLATVTRAIYEWAGRRTQWWMKNLALWLRRHQRFGRWLGPLVEPGRREVQSVIILGLLLVLSLTALIAVLLVSPLSTPAWEAGFRFSGLAASLRSHFADPGILAIKLAASPRVMAGLIALVAAVLLLMRRPVALSHWLLATLGGVLLALLLDGLVGMLLQRPAGPGSIAEVPNVEFTLAVLVLGFGAQMLARDLRPRRRKWLYLTVVVILGLIGFSG